MRTRTNETSLAILYWCRYCVLSQLGVKLACSGTYKFVPPSFVHISSANVNVHLQAVKYGRGDGSDSIPNIDTLMLADADVNAVCTHERRTALMWACAQGKADVACRLVEHSVSYAHYSVDNEYVAEFAILPTTRSTRQYECYVRSDWRTGASLGGWTGFIRTASSL